MFPSFIKLPLESFRYKNFNVTLEVQFQLEKPWSV